MKLTVGLSCFASYITVMYLFHSILFSIIPAFGLFFLVPFAALSFFIAVLIEKSHQRRSGIKRPIIRWNND